MPNFVSEAHEREDGEEAEERKGTEKGFDLSKVREKLVAARAAEAYKAQQDSNSGFNLQTARRNLERPRAEKAAKQPRVDAAAAPVKNTLKEKGWQYGCHASRIIRPGWP